MKKAFFLVAFLLLENFSFAQNLPSFVITPKPTSQPTSAPATQPATNITMENIATAVDEEDTKVNEQDTDAKIKKELKDALIRLNNKFQGKRITFTTEINNVVFKKGKITISTSFPTLKSNMHVSFFVKGTEQTALIYNKDDNLEVSCNVALNYTCEHEKEIGINKYVYIIGHIGKSGYSGKPIYLIITNVDIIHNKVPFGQVDFRYNFDHRD